MVVSLITSVIFAAIAFYAARALRDRLPPSWRRSLLFITVSAIGAFITFGMISATIFAAVRGEQSGSPLPGVAAAVLAWIFGLRGATDKATPRQTSEDGRPTPLPQTPVGEGPLIWFYEKDAAPMGPVSKSRFEQLAAAHEIARDTLVWRDGLLNWLPAEHSELAPIFDDIPPPLPRRSDTR